MEAGTHQERSYAPDQRVYAPTRGSAAYAYAEPAESPYPYAPPAAEPQQKPAAAPARKPKVKPLSLGGRLLIVISILMVTGASLTMVARYAMIAQQYGLVNELKDDIEDSELRLAQLNVALECAVSLDDAKAAAERMGMTYPTAAQYVAVGEPLPAAALERPPAEPETTGEPEPPEEGPSGA